MSNRDAIKARIVEKSTEDPVLDAARLAAQKELVEIEGRRTFFDLRKMWSVMIIIWISVFIVFHITLTFMIGFKILDFTSHKWMVPLIVSENFLQVVGMGLIVVRFFHPGNDSKTPKLLAKTE